MKWRDAQRGTITLCQTCGRAIQLRRIRVRSCGALGSSTGWQDLDMWQHMGDRSVTGPWHEAIPAG